MSARRCAGLLVDQHERRDEAAAVDGRICSWAGDRGLIAFALRIGVDAGLVKFCTETGTIVSHVINNAAHLEKKSTRAGMVSISRNVLRHPAVRRRAGRPGAPRLIGQD